MTYLSEVRVGVESTLVADGGLALGAGVVVGWSRRVGQLRAAAHRAQFAARHGRDLRHRVGRGGRHAAIGRPGRRAASPGAARAAEVDLEVSAGGVLPGTRMTSVAYRAGPGWAVTCPRAGPHSGPHAGPLG